MAAGWWCGVRKEIHRSGPEFSVLEAKPAKILPAKSQLWLYFSLKLPQIPKCSALLPQAKLISPCLGFVPSFPKSNPPKMLKMLQQVPCTGCTRLLGQQLLLTPPSLLSLDFSRAVFCVELAPNYLYVHAVHSWLWIPKGCSNLGCCGAFTLLGS